MEHNAIQCLIVLKVALERESRQHTSADPTRDWRFILTLHMQIPRTIFYTHSQLQRHTHTHMLYICMHIDA